MKVLVVDDDPVALETSKAVLEGLGHEVVVREHALGTTSAILDERPDVVLVDVEMPALPGDELIRVVRRRGAALGLETVFILYSGRNLGELERLVEETGAVGAIEKTGSLASLAADFARIVNGL
jgi:CheY-like chemotaxis protein